jgi:hypothetical protein
VITIPTVADELGVARRLIDAQSRRMLDLVTMRQTIAAALKADLSDAKKLEVITAALKACK